MEQALVGGFHIAMAQGPLCDEPMQAIGIIIEEWILEDKNGRNNIEVDNDKNEEEKKILNENTSDNEERLIGVEGRSTDSIVELNEKEENLQKCDSSHTNCNIPSTSQINDQVNEEMILERTRRRHKQLYMNAQLHGQLISAMRQVQFFKIILGST